MEDNDQNIVDFKGETVNFSEKFSNKIQKTCLRSKCGLSVDLEYRIVSPTLTEKDKCLMILIFQKPILYIWIYTDFPQK